LNRIPTMNQLLVLVVLGFVGAAVAAPDEISSHWANFKRVHQKLYDAEEDFHRRAIFEANVAKVVKHNIEADMGLHKYRLAVNAFADETNQEFRSRRNGLRMSVKQTNGPYADFHDYRKALPKTVDWRTKGIVTPVKNQAQCGSCWAFAAVASLEGQHAKATGKLVSLSEQNLVDCSGPQGNMGCEGGLPDQAYEYIKENGGIDTEKSYPYTAQDGTCRFKKAAVGATLKGYTDIQQGSESALQKAVASVGPISVGIDASNESFQLYSGGVYDEESCSTTQLDHGVTVVGYGSENGQDYWLVKNSWGAAWGEQGYIKMSRNSQNQCGIASLASYPRV